MKVERAAIIHAASERIVSLVDTLYMWHAWLASERRHPMANRTYSATKRGRGAAVTSPSGRIEILESSADAIMVAIDADRAEFRFKTVEGGTQVMWTMNGRRISATDVEVSLQNLKSIAERPSGTERNDANGNSLSQLPRQLRGSVQVLPEDVRREAGHHEDEGRAA